MYIKNMTSHFCLFTDWGSLGYWSPIYNLNSVKPGGEKEPTDKVLIQPTVKEWVIREWDI